MIHSLFLSVPVIYNYSLQFTQIQKRKDSHGLKQIKTKQNKEESLYAQWFVVQDGL